MPTLPFNATAATGQPQTSETTYDINWSDNSHWIGTRSTMSKTEVGCYLTNGSTFTNYKVLNKVTFNRTGNIGALTGYVYVNPAKDLYIAKGASATKTSIQPKYCQTLTIRGIKELTGAVGSCHCVFTGDKLINVIVVGDAVLRFTGSVTFNSFAAGAGFFFTLPLIFDSFT